MLYDAVLCVEWMHGIIKKHIYIYTRTAYTQHTTHSANLLLERFVYICVYVMPIEIHTRRNTRRQCCIH